jgi:hypothetical protein
MSRMRTVILAALLLLAACGAEPLVVTIPLKPGATHLEMPEALPLRRYQYKLEVVNNVRRQVQLEARLEEPAPAGVVARIGGTNTIPREGTGWPWLVVIVPEVPGPFQGTIAITSPEVPDWVLRYTFAGEVVDRPREGRNMSARPPGVDLGNLAPGDEKAFAVALASFGSEDVEITEWVPSDPAIVRLPRLGEPVVVKTGGEYQLVGAIVAPRAAGPFDAAVRVRSDAQNHKGGVFDVRFRGTVVPDYAPHPPRAVETAAYPAEGTEFKMKIVAREGVPPFTVAEAKGHERYFEVLSLGTPEPAREQLVKLKLRRDAPTDATRPAEWQVRFRVEPSGVEVTWPLRLYLYPPIHASPREISFGTVSQGAPKEAEILLSALAQRAFRVTGARAEGRRVRVTVPEHAPGTTWRVLVSLPEGLAPGVIEDRIVIETDDKDVPQLIVPVKADIR